MAQMTSDDERKSVKYGDILQLTNWILDLGATCLMTPEVSDFILETLEDTDKYIEVRTEVKYEYKCWTITKGYSLQHYTTYYYHQTYVTGYFQ